jgi:ADP-ribose pyrophosphatase
VPITEAGELVMTRSYKHGPRRVTLNAPAGYLNTGETPLHAAQRELFEETGYTAREWEPLGSFMVDGNRQCGTAHLFLARNAQRVAAASNPDPNEVVEIELVSPARFFEQARDGEVVVLSTICAVSMAMLAKARLESRRTEGQETASS